MDRAAIIASGIVQGVGFRYMARAEARSIGITGYVKNLEGGTVEIVAEGTRSNIELFIQKIRNAEEPVVVDDIRMSYQKATGEFKQFGIITGDILAEMVEGFGTGHMLFERSNRKQDQMLDKQDQMLDKQDQMLDKQDQMLDKQDETITEIRGLSENMHDMMDRRFQRLEGDVRLIKEKIGL